MSASRGRRLAKLRAARSIVGQLEWSTGRPGALPSGWKGRRTSLYSLRAWNLSCWTDVSLIGGRGRSGAGAGVQIGAGSWGGRPSQGWRLRRPAAFVSAARSASGPLPIATERALDDLSFTDTKMRQQASR